MKGPLQACMTTSHLHEAEIWYMNGKPTDFVRTPETLGE